MSSRFVILHHTYSDQQAGSAIQQAGSVIQQAGSASGEHWDLMLEHDGVLLTWQLLTEPKGAESLPIRAKRIADHRLAYLTYEGPISVRQAGLTGDRGHVRRIDAGTVEFHEITPDRFVITLDGSEIRWRFVLGRHGESVVQSE